MDQRICIYFLSLCSYPEDSSKARGRQSRGSDDCPTVDNTSLVAVSDTTYQRTMFSSAEASTNSTTSTKERLHSSTKKDVTGCLHVIRRLLKSKGLSTNAVNIIMESWQKSTKKQYDVYIRKWISFCGDKINPFHSSVENILEFFTSLFNQGLRYSVFQTARAAINNLTNICGNVDFSDNPLLKRFMMGVFASLPSLPRYTSVWDTNLVLSYLTKLKNTTLLQLSCKFCTLFLLLTAQRCQTLHLIKLDDIEFSEDKVVIHTNHLLKQSKPGHHLNDISLH